MWELPCVAARWFWRRSGRGCLTLRTVGNTELFEVVDTAAQLVKTLSGAFKAGPVPDQI